MTRVFLILAIPPLLAAVGGFLHMQFSRKQDWRAGVASAGLLIFGLVLIGASAAAPTW